MSIRASIRRVIALQLLSVLPAVAGARLSLDLQANLESSPGVEVQHRAGCSLAHDHRVCALLIRSPWSPESRSTSIAPLLPPVTPAAPRAATRVPDAGRQTATARAPPLAA